MKTQEDRENSLTFLSGIIAHDLKNAMAEVSAEAYRLPGNEELQRAVHRLSRIVSDTLYAHQLQSSSLASPPGESLPAHEVLELLQIRLQGECDARNIAVTIAADPETSVFSNLDFLLESLERLCLISFGSHFREKPFHIDAVQDHPHIILGPVSLEAGTTEDSLPDTLPECNRLSLLVARSLLAFLGCRLELQERGTPREWWWRLSIPTDSREFAGSCHG